MVTICVILFVSTLAEAGLIFLLMRWHKQEMESLAADFSERIQEYQRKLTIVCTEGNTEEAGEICLHTRLNRAAEEMADRSEGSESIHLN